VRVVVQRVSRASVSTGGERLGQIGLGAVLLVGIGRGDDAETADRMADRVVGLRYFRDAEGRTNLAAADVGASYLVVSQFTLYADTSRGRRPGFTDAAPPELAATLVERLVERLRGHGLSVECGRFGTEMAVELVNDGPFTLVLDSRVT
jgi:D-tyrosyl-tRNA(Tyr) deacylase